MSLTLLTDHGNKRENSYCFLNDLESESLIFSNGLVNQLDYFNRKYMLFLINKKFVKTAFS